MKKVLIYGLVLAILGVFLLLSSIIFGTKTFFKEAPAEILKEGKLDYDDDGLINSEEGEYGTDKTNPDTDGDGISDGDEVYKYKTNPKNEDTDNDGYEDKKEIDAGFDPLKKAKTK